MAKAKMLSAGAKAESKVMTFGVCGTGDPRIDEASRQRAANIVGLVAEEIARKVKMPDDSVNEDERLNDPGVGSIQAANETNISPGKVVTIASRTINCPTDGYVFVIGTTEVRAYLYDSTGAEARFGISKSINAWSGEAEETRMRLPGVLPGATYYMQACAQGLFAVSAGNNTFHLNAQELNGDIYVSGRQLSVMFFPTAYGSVDTTD